MNKVDYMYSIRPHMKKILQIPLVILPESTIPRGTRTYEPQPHLKWLGIIFDSKLSWAAGCLSANTTNGLSHQYMKGSTMHASYQRYPMLNQCGGLGIKAK